MGLIVQIKNIQSPNNFKLFYRTGRTPGSSSEQSSSTWGTQYTGGTSVSGVFSAGTTTITIDLMDPSYLIDSNPYGKQYWFKILDLVTGSYIIENIYIHDISFYTELCATPTPTPTPTATPDCTFTGGSAVTDAPTPTPTSTIVIDCTFTGGSAFVGPTPTPTTPLPTPTSTSVPPTATVPPPTPTPTIEPFTNCVKLTLSSLQNGSVCSYDKYRTATVTLYDVTGTNIVNATTDINVVLEVYTDGVFDPVTITIPNGQSSGSDDIYVLEWLDCGFRNESISRTIDGIWSIPSNITECPVVPPPTPTPTSFGNLNWYFSRGAGTTCTASYFEIMKNGVQAVMYNNSSGSSSGFISVVAGDVLIIRVNTGNQSSPTGCSNAYVQYSGQQFDEDPQTGFNNAEITITVSAGDISYASIPGNFIMVCGTIGGGICPV